MVAMMTWTAELSLVPVIAGYHWCNSGACELRVLWESQPVKGQGQDARSSQLEHKGSSGTQTVQLPLKETLSFSVCCLKCPLFIILRKLKFWAYFMNCKGANRTVSDLVFSLCKQWSFCNASVVHILSAVTHAECYAILRVVPKNSEIWVWYSSIRVRMTDKDLF